MTLLFSFRKRNSLFQNGDKELSRFLATLITHCSHWLLTNLGSPLDRVLSKGWKDGHCRGMRSLAAGATKVKKL